MRRKIEATEMDGLREAARRTVLNRCRNEKNKTNKFKRKSNEKYRERNN